MLNPKLEIIPMKTVKRMRIPAVLFLTCELFLLNPSILDGAENDSTVVLDSIAYRIWTDTTHYSVFDIIPINFEYANLTDTTLQLISGSGNMVLLSFIDTLGIEYQSTVYAGTSHYAIQPFDTLAFSDTVALDIQWRPGTYYARGKPDIWGSDLPYAEIRVFIETYAKVNNDLEIPTSFSLSQNAPNPFNPTTTIEFSVPRSGLVTLTVYDLLGREVETILNEPLTAGWHKIEWDASNVPSGIYFVRMHAANPSTGPGQGFIQTRKVTVLK